MDVKEMTEIRHRIHQNPEIAYQEFETAKLVAAKLREYGFDEIHEKIGVTGVVGVLKSSLPGKRTVGLRADMDALEITEICDESARPYKSKNPRYHHACGHDGHCAILLGAAKYLAKNRDKFNGTINFIFQPAEEGGAGAQIMMNDGLFKRFPCDEIYGLHNKPTLETGTVDAFAGPRMCGAEKFEITITGKGGHGAYPWMCKDPVVAAAQIILALQTLVSRQMNAFESVVLSITMLSGSNACNIIPEKCTLGGTLRTFKNEIRDTMIARVNDMVEKMSVAMGVTGKVEWGANGYPPLVNYPSQTELVRNAAIKVLGANRLAVERSEPVMGAEDFSFYLQEVPGCYFFLGAGLKEPNIHSAYFNFNDSILEAGCAMFVEVACASLRQPPTSATDDQVHKKLKE